VSSGVKGSLLSSVMGKVSQLLEFTQETVAKSISSQLQQIIVRELDTFFSLLAITMSDTNSEMKTTNPWVGSYRVPKLKQSYFEDKVQFFGANGAEYFKGRYGLSKQHGKRYTRGHRKGKERYPFSQSLYGKIDSLKDVTAGNVLFDGLGGLGTSNQVQGASNASLGKVVGGRAKKIGKRGTLINARWQDIVSKEFLRMGRTHKHSSLAKGFYRTENKNKIQRPDGRVISLAQAIAKGHVTFNIKGEFFRNLEQSEQGFLNFLIEHTSFLKLSNPQGRRKVNSLEQNLKAMAKDGRLLIDPVFGEVLESIEFELDDVISRINNGKTT